ncbi:calcium permeable stress-gated cation channel, partial [Tremellales sp. Uapishka_1]
MSATGKDTQSSTTGSFIAALVTAGITVGALSAFWLAFHGQKKLRRVYQPRIELAPASKRPAELPSGPIPFWRAVLATPDQEIIISNGPDAYFFVRFLKIFGIHMLIPYFLLTFIICIPLSAAGPTAGETGLNILGFGNVASNKQNRHIGHFLVALILIGWTLHLVYKEYEHFISVRQAWFASPQHLTLARSRTVSMHNLPPSINSVEGIKGLGATVARLTGSSLPRQSMASGEGNGVGESESGGIRTVWLTRQAKDLTKIWEEREAECLRLESGVGKLVSLGNKNERKGKTPEKKGKLDTERGGADMVDRYVNPKKRPTWKQGLLGLIGKKMTLETSPIYIREHNEQIKSLRTNLEKEKTGDVAFARFGSQHEAHAFARLLSSTDKEFKNVKTGIELIPEDVQWGNTAMSAHQRMIRTAISWALTIFLLIIWAVPVAFVGSISNVDTLCTKASWLAWLCTIPPAALAIIKGVLPPVLLAVLFMLLPIFLRMWIRLQGEIRKSDIDLKLFTRFWLFQVVHGFLIVTLASGLIASIPSITSDPSQAPALLATRLPGASIFFLTFILTTAFSGAAKSYSRAVPYVMYLLRGILAGNTPRKVYQKEWKMASFAWGTTFPPICLLTCLCIVYSVIQPVITLVGLIAFGLLYGAYKYLLQWTADQPDYMETGGLFYIKALRTIFVSLYIEEICLIGLFFLSTDQTGKRAKSGLACGAIMIVVLIVTAAFQAYIDHFGFKRASLIYTTSAMHPNSSQSKLTLAQTAVDEEFENAGPELGNTSGFHENAFDHPAYWKKQPCVWIANDQLGIGKHEAEKLNNERVEASTAHNEMDAKGTITTTRNAPDEAWYEGATQ